MSVDVPYRSRDSCGTVIEEERRSKRGDMVVTKGTYEDIGRVRSEGSDDPSRGRGFV